MEGFDLQQFIQQFFTGLDLNSFAMDDLGAAAEQFEAETALETRFEEALADGAADEVSAMTREHPELLRMEKADWLGMRPLHLAAFYGEPASLRVLLEHYPDEELVARLAERDGSHLTVGKTPLLHAASTGRADCVNLLLKRGASVRNEMRFLERWCALSHAAAFRLALWQVQDTADAQIVSPQALAAGVDEGQMRISGHDGQDGKWNDRNWSALMHAADACSPELCWLLLRAGARTSTRSMHGLSAADIAAQHAAEGRVGAQEVADMLHNLWVLVPLSQLHDVLGTCTSREFKARLRATLLALHRTTGGRADRNVMDTLARIAAREERENAA